MGGRRGEALTKSPCEYLCCVSIPIGTCKFTKNHSYIVSGTSIPTSTRKSIILDHPKDVMVEDYIELKNCLSQYSGNNQWSKVDVEIPRLPEKDTELF